MVLVWVCTSNPQPIVTISNLQSKCCTQLKNCPMVLRIIVVSRTTCTFGEVSKVLRMGAVRGIDWQFLRLHQDLCQQPTQWAIFNLVPNSKFGRIWKNNFSYLSFQSAVWQWQGMSTGSFSNKDKYVKFRYKFDAKACLGHLSIFTPKKIVWPWLVRNQNYATKQVCLCFFFFFFFLFFLDRRTNSSLWTKQVWL